MAVTGPKTENRSLNLKIYEVMVGVTNQESDCLGARLTLELTGGTASVDLGWSSDIHKARWSKWQRAVASECSDWLGSAAWLIAFPLICRAKF